MKKCLLLFLMMIASCFLYSQTSSIFSNIVSGKIKDSKGIFKSVKNAFLLSDGRIDLIIYSLGKLSISQINPKSGEETSVDFPISFQATTVVLKACFLTDDVINMFFAVIDEKKMEKSLWVIKVNDKTLNRIGSSEMLFSSKYIKDESILWNDFYKGVGIDERSGYFVTENHNTRKFLVLEFLDKTSSNYNVKVSVLDESLDVENSYRFNSGKEIIPVLDNENSVYFISSDYYSFGIVHSNHTGIKTKYPKMLNMKFHDINLFSNEIGLFMTGFYSHNAEIPCGMYCAKINLSDNTTIECDTADIKAGIDDEMLITSSHKMKRKIAKQFTISSVLEMPDGGFATVSEIVYEQDELFEKQKIDYYYHDIFVMRADQYGNIQWVCKVPRFIHTDYYRRFAGFSAFVQNDDIILIYNDDERNLLSASENVFEASLRSKYSVTTIARINAHGDLKREILFRYKDMNSIANPLLSPDVFSDGKYFVLHYKGPKVYQYSIVTIP